jgi:Holliday junction DNA helicase RuvA
MIARLSGKVIEREVGALIVDVHGVGYRVRIFSRVRDKVRQGQEITLHIHHHTGQDEESLFGFESKEDLHYFDLLLTVPSVGPKTAMNILEIAPSQVLEQAISERDTALLTKVSGVGKRTAERILVELREKIKAPSVRSATGSIQQETIEALVSIGYTVAQAREAVQKLPADIKSVEEAVRAILQRQPV